MATQMSFTTLPDTCDPFLSSADHLCDDCSSLGHEIRQLCEVEDYSISRPRDSVERNSSSCAFCEMIASDPGLKSGTGDFIIHNKRHRSESGSRPADGIERLTVERESRLCLRLAIFTTECSVPAMAKHVSGRCIKAASNLDQARHWLNDCLRNHDHGSSRAATHPSRLLAVGTADGSEQIRIVDNLDSNARYLAVSYRWGGMNSLLATAKMSELFRTSIAWDKLPRTFQDAIQIARELRIGYVWIDSLCITQDDPDDWEIESAKMADIYNGALLTIMAASASDSQGGFFRDRATVKEIVALPYTDTSGSTKFSVFAGRNLAGYEDIVVSGPLFGRGWVFQERLMSKRKLIFGQDETYWECNSLIQSESSIRRRDKFANMNRQDNDAFRTFSDLSYKPDETWGKTSPTNLWHNVVVEYSRCSLIYETDRLPALSGLARTFAQRFGGTYVAGFWLDQIPQSMSWYKPSHMSKKSCNQVYCAPSWSWASRIGGINFRTDWGINELEVVSTDIKLGGRDPYGRVCPGSSICLRGRLRSGRLVAREDEYTAWLETKHGRLRRRGFLDRNDEDLPLEVSFLEVSPGFGKTHAWSHCLLLHRTATENHFRRVGLADLDEVSQAEDYLFHGLEKQVVTIL